MDFILGFIFGIFATLGGVYYAGRQQLKKLRKTKDALLEDLKKTLADATAGPSKLNEAGRSIEARLIKASEITQTQMMLRARAEQPSANALDSRYKNGLIGEITTLEHQKLEILNSILTDGFDPKITVIGHSGKKEEMLLSHYISEALSHVGGELPPEPAAKPVTEQIAPGIKKVGKFIVIDGGNGGEGTTH
jgi:hypothetical protein